MERLLKFIKLTERASNRELLLSPHSILGFRNETDGPVAMVPLFNVAPQSVPAAQLPFAVIHIKDSWGEVANAVAIASAPR